MSPFEAWDGTNTRTVCQLGLMKENAAEAEAGTEGWRNEEVRVDEQRGDAP